MPEPQPTSTTTSTNSPAIPDSPVKMIKTTPSSPSTPATVIKPDSLSLPSLLVTPDDWYALGDRVWYDAEAKAIVEPPREGDRRSLLQVFRRVVIPNHKNKKTEPDTSTSLSTDQRWMTFLPGDPEGSFGYHAVEEALCCPHGRTAKGRCDTECTEGSTDSLAAAFDSPPSSPRRRQDCPTTQEATREPQEQENCATTTAPRLYLDYIGQGNSDTPTVPLSERSLTKQRADLVEALWHAQGIQRTVVVSVGESSSLVTMELLQRQRVRLAAGSPFPKILHVLSLNGRYVAKTRHTSQLPTVTQLLRSDRMGPSLASKAQRSDFTLSQCLGPYLRGCTSKQVRKQVASIVRRHDGTTSLRDMAKIVDDHLDAQHRYRWHLPHLLKVFCLDQGITWHVATTSKSRQAAHQKHLVQRQLDDDEYELSDIPHVQYKTLHGPASTTSFLLDSSSRPEHLEAWIQAIRQLQNTEIPMSDNTEHRAACAACDLPWRTSFDETEQGEDDEDDDHAPHDNDSYLEDDEDHDDDDLATAESLDTRLETEIVFDVVVQDHADYDDDDFDLF